MGKIEKGVRCSVTGCESTAVRSISVGKADLFGRKVEGEKRTYLCAVHYKDFKKQSKGVRQVERWRWNS